MRGAADVTVERVLHGSERFGLAKRWEFHIFGEVNHYLSPADEQAGEVLAYRPFEVFSEFHVAWADPTDDEPVGLIRFIRFDPSKGLDSFITLRDFRAWPDAQGVAQNKLDSLWERRFAGMDPSRVAELATEAVVPGRRGEGVVERMWLSLRAASDLEGIDVWTMALVPDLYDLYKAMFPLAVNRIGDVIPDYIGADSLPATIDTRHPEVEAFKHQLEALDARRREARGPRSSVPSTDLPNARRTALSRENVTTTSRLEIDVPTRIVTTSAVAAAAEDVWRRTITPEGINDELGPFLRMTVPASVRGKSIEDFEPGQRVCRSWFLLFGVIPLDYDDIVIAEVGPDMRFVESSTMLSIRTWRHERRVTPTPDGCEVTDEVSFVLRRPSAWIPGMRLLVRAFLAFLFRHRHRRLARRFQSARRSGKQAVVLQTAS